jgi:hypothetical protein
LLGEADKDTAPQLKFLPDLNRSIDSDSTCEIFCYFSIEPPEDFDFVGPIQLPNFMHDLCGIHSGTIPFDRSHPDFWKPTCVVDDRRTLGRAFPFLIVLSSKLTLLLVVHPQLFFQENSD